MLKQASISFSLTEAVTRLPTHDCKKKNHKVFHGWLPEKSACFSREADDDLNNLLTSWSANQ